MGLGVDLRLVLLGISGVTTLAGTRIYVDHAPRGTTGDHLIIEVDREDRENELQPGTGGWNAADVNIICRADKRPDADALAAAVKAGLAGYVGSAFDAVLDGSADARSPKDDASQDWWYDTNLSFAVCGPG